MRASDTNEDGPVPVPLGAGGSVGSHAGERERLLTEPDDASLALDEARLGELLARGNVRSGARAVLHVTILCLLAAMSALTDVGLFWAICVIALAAVMASMFAPFHECAHSTAFASRRFNILMGWIAAISFGMSPTLYRDFHFAHHRHTQDPQRDPELLANPALLLDWPDNVRDWLYVVGGPRLLSAKLKLMRNLWLGPDSAYRYMSTWAPRDRFPRMVRETRILSFVWGGLLVGAATGVPGCFGLALALLLSHLFQSLWLSTEHTGRPSTGTLLERTRSVLTIPPIRWFLWNMNFHAEHHAWPGVPWYRLPELRELVSEHVPTEPGYLHVHRGVWRRLSAQRGEGDPT